VLGQRNQVEQPVQGERSHHLAAQQADCGSLQDVLGHVSSAGAPRSRLGSRFAAQQTLIGDISPDCVGEGIEVAIGLA
jgi:hypothetical protein